MNYNIIVNPLTNKKCNISGKKGTQILNEYLRQIGGNKTTITIYPELHKEVSSNDINMFIDNMTQNSEENIIKNANLTSALMSRIKEYIHNNTNLLIKIVDKALVIEISDFPVNKDDKLDFLQNFILNYSFDHPDFIVDSVIYNLGVEKLLINGNVFRLPS